MKLFAVSTRSESGDQYIYILKHKKTPTAKELKWWIKENAVDREDDTCYENITCIIQMSEENASTIPGKDMNPNMDII